ncbi:hypothetical protein O181_075055 [Austropuccinia psidii MF-1]|uniref:Uncharacterized protein n=1 Tax=Austropuccinia psidii MF-1 TaxID=1389203 RepID=A0A9Q3FDN2_9BASI|nr:hypothetical protein [Austropuccinia psidii MF-1]
MKFAFSNTGGAGFWTREGLNCEISLFSNIGGDALRIILDKARHNANRCMQNSFKYEKERWDKSHKPPDVKVGDLVLVLPLSPNKIKGPKKIKDYFEGTFMIRALHGPNAGQLELTGELMNKQLSQGLF